MKIAIVSTVEETIPPKKYGGTEWIVYHIAHSMGKRGHEVDLYASGDSQKDESYSIIPIVPTHLRGDKETANDPKVRESAKLLSLSKAAHLIRNKKYDIVHNHAGWRFLLFAPFIQCPIITNQHRDFNTPYENFIYNNNMDQPFVSISNNQRKDAPRLNFVSTVYNGIDVGLFPFYQANTDHDHAHLTFLARMNKEKGAIEAAEACLQAKKHLIVAAKVDLVDQPYYEIFKKYINNQTISFRGEIEHIERLDILQHARALIAPIQWEEPFGLMFTESMACGTPVIAYSRGSAPEIVIDGKTGFLVNQSDEFIRGNFIVKKTGIDGLAEAIDRIFSMSQEEYRNMRLASRKHVEDHFSVKQMINGYENAYKQLIRL